MLVVRSPPWDGFRNRLSPKQAYDVFAGEEGSATAARSRYSRTVRRDNGTEDGGMWIGDIVMLGRACPADGSG